MVAVYIAARGIETTHQNPEGNGRFIGLGG